MKMTTAKIYKLQLLIAIALLTLSVSCDRKKVQELENSIEIPSDLTVEKLMENTEEYQLLGRKGKIIFPDRTAEVEYIDETRMHWKTTNDKNEIIQGDEKINYVQISEQEYFVNWIEDTGFTVSQIINTKTGDVKAFWSFADTKSGRGGRSSLFVDGKFEFGE